MIICVIVLFRPKIFLLQHFCWVSVHRDRQIHLGGVAVEHQLTKANIHRIVMSGAVSPRGRRQVFASPSGLRQSRHSSLIPTTARRSPSPAPRRGVGRVISPPKFRDFDRSPSLERFPNTDSRDRKAAVAATKRNDEVFRTRPDVASTGGESSTSSDDHDSAWSEMRDSITNLRKKDWQTLADSVTKRKVIPPGKTVPISMSCSTISSKFTEDQYGMSSRNQESRDDDSSVSSDSTETSSPKTRRKLPFFGRLRGALGRRQKPDDIDDISVDESTTSSSNSSRKRRMGRNATYESVSMVEDTESAASKTTRSLNVDTSKNELDSDSDSGDDDDVSEKPGTLITSPRAPSEQSNTSRTSPRMVSSFCGSPMSVSSPQSRRTDVSYNTNKSANSSLPEKVRETQEVEVAAREPNNPIKGWIKRRAATPIPFRSSSKPKQRRNESGDAGSESDSQMSWSVQITPQSKHFWNPFGQCNGGHDPAALRPEDFKWETMPNEKLPRISPRSSSNTEQQVRSKSVIDISARSGTDNNIHAKWSESSKIKSKEEIEGRVSKQRSVTSLEAVSGSQASANGSSTGNTTQSIERGLKTGTLASVLAMKKEPTSAPTSPRTFSSTDSDLKSRGIPSAASGDGDRLERVTTENTSRNATRSSLKSHLSPMRDRLLGRRFSEAAKRTMEKSADTVVHNRKPESTNILPSTVPQPAESEKASSSADQTSSGENSGAGRFVRYGRFGRNRVQEQLSRRAITPGPTRTGSGDENEATRSQKLKEEGNQKTIDTIATKGLTRRSLSAPRLGRHREAMFRKEMKASRDEVDKDHAAAAATTTTGRSERQTVIDLTRKSSARDSDSNSKSESHSSNGGLDLEYINAGAVSTSGSLSRKYTNMVKSLGGGEATKPSQGSDEFVEGASGYDVTTDARARAASLLFGDEGGQGSEGPRLSPRASNKLRQRILNRSRSATPAERASSQISDSKVHVEISGEDSALERSNLANSTTKTASNDIIDKRPLPNSRSRSLTPTSTSRGRTLAERRGVSTKESTQEVSTLSPAAIRGRRDSLSHQSSSGALGRESGSVKSTVQPLDISAVPSETNTRVSKQAPGAEQTNVKETRARIRERLDAAKGKPVDESNTPDPPNPKSPQRSQTSAIGVEQILSDGSNSGVAGQSTRGGHFESLRANVQHTSDLATPMLPSESLNEVTRPSPRSPRRKLLRSLSAGRSRPLLMRNLTQQLQSNVNSSTESKNVFQRESNISNERTVLTLDSNISGFNKSTKAAPEMSDMYYSMNTDKPNSKGPLWMRRGSPLRIRTDMPQTNEIQEKKTTPRPFTVCGPGLEGIRNEGSPKQTIHGTHSLKATTSSPSRNDGMPPILSGLGSPSKKVGGENGALSPKSEKMKLILARRKKSKSSLAFFANGEEGIDVMLQKSESIRSSQLSESNRTQNDASSRENLGGEQKPTFDDETVESPKKSVRFWAPSRRRGRSLSLSTATDDFLAEAAVNTLATEFPSQTISPKTIPVVQTNHHDVVREMEPLPDESNVRRPLRDSHVLENLDSATTSNAASIQVRRTLSADNLETIGQEIRLQPMSDTGVKKGKRTDSTADNRELSKEGAVSTLLHHIKPNQSEHATDTKREHRPTSFSAFPLTIMRRRRREDVGPPKSTTTLEPTSPVNNNVQREIVEFRNKPDSKPEIVTADIHKKSIGGRCGDSSPIEAAEYSDGLDRPPRNGSHHSENDVQTTSTNKPMSPTSDHLGHVESSAVQRQPENKVVGGTVEQTIQKVESPSEKPRLRPIGILRRKGKFSGQAVVEGSDGSPKRSKKGKQQNLTKELPVVSRKLASELSRKDQSIDKVTASEKMMNHNTSKQCESSQDIDASNAKSGGRKESNSAPIVVSYKKSIPVTEIEESEDGFDVSLWIPPDQRGVAKLVPFRTRYPKYTTGQKLSEIKAVQQEKSIKDAATAPSLVQKKLNETEAVTQFHSKRSVSQSVSESVGESTNDKAISNSDTKKREDVSSTTVEAVSSNVDAAASGGGSNKNHNGVSSSIDGTAVERASSSVKTGSRSDSKKRPSNSGVDGASSKVKAASSGESKRSSHSSEKSSSKKSKARSVLATQAGETVEVIIPTRKDRADGTDSKSEQENSETPTVSKSKIIQRLKKEISEESKSKHKKHTEHHSRGSGDKKLKSKQARDETSERSRGLESILGRVEGSQDDSSVGESSTGVHRQLVPRSGSAPKQRPFLRVLSHLRSRTLNSRRSETTRSEWFSRNTSYTTGLSTGISTGFSTGISTGVSSGLSTGLSTGLSSFGVTTAASDVSQSTGSSALSQEASSRRRANRLSSLLTVLEDDQSSNDLIGRRQTEDTDQTSDVPLRLDSEIGLLPTNPDDDHHQDDDDVAKLPIWMEIVDALERLANSGAHILKKDGTFDFSRAASGDSPEGVKEAFQTIHHHATRLGVSDEELVQAVRDSDGATHGGLRPIGSIQSDSTIASEAPNMNMSKFNLTGKVEEFTEDFFDMIAGYLEGDLTTTTTKHNEYVVGDTTRESAPRASQRYYSSKNRSSRKDKLEEPSGKRRSSRIEQSQ